MPQLKLSDYMSHIQLDEIYLPSLLSSFNREVLTNELLEALLVERKEIPTERIPVKYSAKRNLLKVLLTTREPAPLAQVFLKKLNSLLQLELRERGLVRAEQLKTVYEAIPLNNSRHSKIYSLWQGDITQLQTDAIVNAANKYMLGCFQPLHACIDNAIHSAAGPQLREDCKMIRSIQRAWEKTGGAKITRGYNLPAKFVLHTVGPIVPNGTEPTEKQKAELASSYISCLELANKIEEIKTLAFCAISTGVFGFPKQEAARIAVRTVDEWLSTHPHRFEKIIFNVFNSDDYNVYSEVFKFKNGGGYYL